MFRPVTTLVGLITFAQLLPFASYSQKRFQGKVFSKNDSIPIAFASVVTTDRKANGTFTDTSGVFSFSHNRNVRTSDSVIISAIGHQPMKLPLKEFEKVHEVWLEANQNILENVIVVSTLKGSHSQFGYFRSWREKRNNGEIGQVVQLPNNRVQIGSVQVKINKNYDTCWIKLHVRAMGRYGFPEEDLLKKEVIVPALVNNGLVEFDLGWEGFRLPTNQVYIGFEVVDCSSPRSDIPSFLFMGSEEGQNIYRDYKEGEWNMNDKYTIYIRMLVK